MMDLIQKLMYEMIDYYRGDPKRTQHFTKVYAYAKLIGETESLDDKTLFTLKAAALVHDIGIKIAEQKYNSSAGKYQELEGPAPAREMLTKLNFADDIIDRICYLIAHHHTYGNIDGIDYQILVEADFIVNLYEDNAKKSAVENALKRIFKTKSGIKICSTMFDVQI